MSNIMKGKPGAGMLTDQGVEPDPCISTWHEWVRVSRDQYNHYVGLDPYADVAQRHHARTTAGLVPHLVAQLEHSWTEIEKWVQWWRDQHGRVDYGDDLIRFEAIDNMLDDLRDHLVAGTSLHRPAGPHAEANEEDRWTP